MRYRERIEESTLRMARYLSNSNFITAEDRESNQSLPSVMKEVLHRELNRITAGMKLFKLDFNFMSKHSANQIYYSQPDFRYRVAFTVSNQGCIPYVLIKEALTQLNAIHPQLDQTIYAVIEKASKNGLGILTFRNCHERFPYELNIPMDDEHRQEMEENEIEYRTLEDINEMAKAFNISWINSAETILTPYEVWKISSTNECPLLIKNTIEAALEVAQAFELVKDQKGLRSMIEADAALALAVVEIFEGDPTQLLLNDIWAICDECPDSYSENLHEEFLCLDSEEAFLSRWQEILNALNLYTKIDKLLYALTQFNEE